MSFSLVFSAEAKEQLGNLETTDTKKHRKVLKTLGLLETNPRHQSLNTHKYYSVVGPDGQQMFEAYVENKTPAAFRVFFYYGPGKTQITVEAIAPHP